MSAFDNGSRLGFQKSEGMPSGVRAAVVAGRGRAELPRWASILNS